jgi:hypothetical protein
LSAASTLLGKETGPAAYSEPQADYGVGEVDADAQQYAAAEASHDLPLVAAATIDAEIATVVAEQTAVLPLAEETDRTWHSADVRAEPDPAAPTDERGVREAASAAAVPPRKEKRNRANGLMRVGQGWLRPRPTPSAALDPTVPASGPEPEPLPASPAAATSEATYSVDWLENALTKLEEEADWAPPKRSQRRSDAPPDPSPIAEPVVAAAESVASPETAADDALGPEVVGKYSAGGVSYSIFVDGSIEADTPKGVYKFQSMDELKAFIAASSAPSSTS